MRRSTPAMRFAGGGAVLAVAIALAACSSPEAEEGEAGDSSEIVAEASANVEQYFANNEAEFGLDPVPDPSLLDGKKVMYLSAGLSSPGGTAGLNALNEVKDALGFESVVYDGQFTISEYQEGMRQAVAQGVDALMVYGVDCAGNEAALKEVRDAGIIIIGLQSVDCNEVDPSAEGLFDAQPLYPLQDGPGTVGALWAASGAAQADYLISELDGDVKAIQFDVPDFAVTASAGVGFRDRMAECSTCEILETVEVGVADFGPSLQGLAEQALLKNPEANAVQIAYDDLVTLGISAAITGSGRAEELTVVAGGGQEATLDLIRSGGAMNAGWVEQYDWDHYAGIDTLLRTLGGEEEAVNAHPVIMYDAEHNLPESGAFENAVDFRAAFLEAWGLE